MWAARTARRAGSVTPVSNGTPDDRDVTAGHVLVARQPGERRQPGVPWDDLTVDGSDDGCGVPSLCVMPGIGSLPPLTWIV